MASCTFCDIIRGDIASAIVYQDDAHFAFLDKTPLFHGHTLLVTRRHIETFLDVPPGEIGPFFQRSQLLAAAIQKACEAQGTFVAMNNVVSQSVPHLHVHIVPRTKGDGLKGFFWPRKKYSSDEQMAEYAHRIRAALKT